MKCSHPGCPRRCLAPHTLCVNHRPPLPRRLDANRRRHDEAYEARRRAIRATQGLPPGWESA